MSELCAKLLEAATRPGLMGLGGMAAERRAKQDLALYFERLRSVVMTLKLEDLVTSPKLLATHGVEMKLHFVLRTMRSDLLNILKTNLEESYLRGWKLVQVQEADDPFPPAGPDILGETGQDAAAYAEEHAAELVTGIDNTTIAQLQNAISQGIEEQLGVGGTGRLIRSVLDEMSVSRAETIASTEMNDAFSQATLDKLDRLGIGYVKWIAEDDACPQCEPNDGEVVALGDVFPSGEERPPVHPNCRCAIVGARTPAE